MIKGLMSKGETMIVVVVVVASPVFCVAIVPSMSSK